MPVFFHTIGTFFRASLEKDEKQTQLSDDLSAQFEAKMVEMNKTFKQQENKWKKHVLKLERHLQEVSLSDS